MRIKKNIFIAVLLITFSVFIGWLSTPYLIELYFNKQPVYSISESKDKLQNIYIKSDKDALLNSFNSDKDNIYLGQSIVLYGYINENDGFSILTNSNGDYIQLESVINKINCIPYKSGNYKIVGAYNMFHNANEPLSLYGRVKYINANLKFNVIWILGGCK